MAYKPFGPVKSMDLGPLALTRSYDRRYQITGIQAGTVLNYGYAHDGAGNVETISGLPKPELAPRQTDVAYTGNRLTSIDTLWTIPPDYPATGASYSHDAAGNIVSDGLHTDYFHNQNNRLIRVEIDGLTVAEYAYDGFERRVKKIADGVTTHFHYDLNGLLISETDGNGNPRKDYVYLNGEPVAMKTYGGSAGWYWFIIDHLGTPQKMVDESGSVVWAAAYAPFGEARVYKDEVVNNLRFPGQYYDVETGLHYNWHRYYDPATGRYLTPDPIGLAGGINPYVYAGGNPVNWFDLEGLYRSHWLLRALVPGQVAWDNAMTALENGEMGYAAMYAGAMVGEQVASAYLGKLLSAYGGGTCQPVSAPKSAGGILRKSSEAAFKAADDVSSWIPKNKHLLGGGSQSKARFATSNIDEVRSIVQKALRSRNAQFLPNPNVPGTFRVVTDLGRPIGVKGQQSVRAIVGLDGKVINAFPVNVR